MVEDAEKHLDLEQRVSELEREIKSLRKKLDKLNKQIDEQVMISGFQEQLNSFHKKVAELEGVLLNTRRYVSTISIEELRINLETWAFNFHPNTHPDIREFLLRKSSAAKQEIKTSSSPISIANKFYEDCESYCKAKGLPYFLEDLV
jgi:hypothetical protein